jgi:hypothetical protein
MISNHQIANGIIADRKKYLALSCAISRGMLRTNCPGQCTLNLVLTDKVVKIK